MAVNGGRAVALVALVVLAGCGGVVGPDGTDRAPSSNDARGPHPWGTGTVTVALVTADAVDEPARHRAFLREAIEFWNAESGTYTAHSVRFAVTTERAEADVVVRAVGRIGACGERTTNGTFGYCTDSYDADERATNGTTARVVARYTDERTRAYYRAVFGTMLGVDDVERLPGVSFADDPRLRDPWPTANPVVINVSNEVNDSRAFAPLVRDAVAYWESGPGARHRNYSVTFAVRPDAKRADVTVRFVPSLARCGDDSTVDANYVGCAPLYSGSFRAGDVSEVVVLGGYTNESTRSTLRHEFGHLHGRLHGQAPLPSMEPSFDAVRLPQPDATAVTQPWPDDELAVFLDTRNVSEARRATWRAELDDALAYVARGADGSVPTAVSFRTVDDPEAADVVIRARSDLPGETASTRELFGRSVDDDPALESYTSLHVSIATDTPSREVGYHVAYWLVRTWAQGEEVPASLDGENDDRTSTPRLTPSAALVRA